MKLIDAKEEHYKEIELIGEVETAKLFIDEDENILGYIWFEFPSNQNSIYESTLFINYINSKNQNIGTGKEMLKYLFKNFDIQCIRGECSDKKKPFWKKVGANVTDEYSDDFREMYEFILDKADFKKYYTKYPCNISGCTKCKEVEYNPPLCDLYYQWVIDFGNF